MHGWFGSVEPIYRDCKYSLMPGVHSGVYFGRQMQVMFPYLEAWHSWGAWGTWWAQSWALQGTEITWFKRHTAHPGRLVFPPSHVDFGSKFTNSQHHGLTNICLWNGLLGDPVTHKIMIYEWSAPLWTQTETSWRLTVSKVLKNPSFPAKLDQFLGIIRTILNPLH